MVPEVGESVAQGVIAAWLKNEGDRVNEGEDLFELETDKATLAVPSPAGGILSIIAREGAEVAVGQVVASIEAAVGAAVESEPKAPAASRKDSKEKTSIDFEINIDETIAGPRAARKATPAGREAVQRDEEESAALSPAVRLLVEQYNLDPKTINGTGKDGRITKGDVLKVLEKQPAPTTAGPATSRAERKAGPGQNRVKMTTIRKRIAENLLQAKQGAAHVTTFNEMDMSGVMALRTAYRDHFEKRHGVRLGFMSFFVKACCNALAAFPVVNAWTEGDDIVYNNYYNIGIAVSTDRGLIVPVIRDADRLSFADIEKAIRDFSTRAREKKLTVDDLTGGTFSITNGGVFGSMLSTPIPSPPQSAILGMHAIKERAVVVDGEVAVRPVMYTALTYDHRLIDGREAVSFLVRVKECIEDPERMLIDI